MDPIIRKISPKIFEISWPAQISKEIAIEMLQVKSLLVDRLGAQLQDVRFGYHRLSISIGKGTCDIDELREFLKGGIAEGGEALPRCWRIPVCYDPEVAKDLTAFLTRKGLDLDEFIMLHTQVDYLLHFYGFLPGFMYLGGLLSELHCPRKDFPDRKIEGGSVGIGGSQTGIYPVESPGGWHVVGKTPLSMFDPASGSLPPYTPGDVIRFFSIDRTEYEQRLIDRSTDWNHA
nr:allophanate hydrolase subunit 1 [Lunatimonas salinarum]